MLITHLILLSRDFLLKVIKRECEERSYKQLIIMWITLIVGVLYFLNFPFITQDKLTVDHIMYLIQRE